MINLAVIGTNFITDRLLEGVALCPGIQATAVYSRTMERAREYAAAHSLPLTFNSLDQLAACQDIDAVYIASPTCCHAAQAVQMLQAGKHVLCEKPIASNQRELNQMLQAADEQGVVLLEAIRAVFTPAYRWLQERLERIGPVRRVSLSFCQYSSRYDKFKNGVIENAFRPELSNGAIMDIGVYPAASDGKPFRPAPIGNGPGRGVAGQYRWRRHRSCPLSRHAGAGSLLQNKRFHLTQRNTGRRRLLAVWPRRRAPLGKGGLPWRGFGASSRRQLPTGYVL